MELQPFLRIGHGGASALAPANTLASFDAACEHGVDMVEFDVRAGRGDLVLAHTVLDVHHRRTVRLDDALRHLAATRFHHMALNVDLKHAGCEAALLDGLRRHGLLGRTLISCQVPSVLDRVRARERRAHLGLSVGGRLARLANHRRRDTGGWRGLVLAGLAERRWRSVMAQHRLVDGALLADVAAGDGRLYAWTVNTRVRIDALRSLGVDGVTSADPRLFDRAPTEFDSGHGAKALVRARLIDLPAAPDPRDGRLQVGTGNRTGSSVEPVQLDTVFRTAYDLE